MPSECQTDWTQIRSDLLSSLIWIETVCKYFFQPHIILTNAFRSTSRLSNRLDPDQARPFVGSDLDLICLQRLSADDTSRQIVKSSLDRIS